ncbi:protein of unknown function [Brevefilum fermentans]|uniref:Uncharacterized protein n=1 Tax=Candidatus Brevifilum fermentans TaxID=1986204 RepID=A0A1Y6K4A6_9CHLR|nr:protein of unknown function [Brevefilum fermentans]
MRFAVGLTRAFHIGALDDVGVYSLRNLRCLTHLNLIVYNPLGYNLPDIDYYKNIESWLICSIKD